MPTYTVLLVVGVRKDSAANKLSGYIKECIGESVDILELIFTLEAKKIARKPAKSGKNVPKICLVAQRNVC